MGTSIDARNTAHTHIHHLLTVALAHAHDLARALSQRNGIVLPMEGITTHLSHHTAAQAPEPGVSRAAKIEGWGRDTSVQAEQDKVVFLLIMCGRILCSINRHCEKHLGCVCARHIR